MRNLRRLPPVLRGASIAALTFPLVAIALLTIAWWWYQSHTSGDSTRLNMIALNLIVAGAVCSTVVALYSTRFYGEQAEGRPIFFGSWQSQSRAIMLLNAPPACAVILALVISPASAAFEFVFPVSLLGALVLIAIALFSVARGARASAVQNRQG